MNNTNTLCPNKELCGSCSWSHIPYDKQLKQKLSDINGSLALNHLPAYLTSVIPSPKLSHYRNRMDFAIDYQGKVGLREKGKWWRVLDGHPCFLSDEIIEKHFWTSRTWSQQAGLSYFDRKKHTGLLRYLVVRSTASGESMISIISSKPESTEEEDKLFSSVAKLGEETNPTSLNLGLTESKGDQSRGEEVISIHGDPWITEKINEYVYRINPNDFFQTNSHGAAILQNLVTEKIKTVAPKVCIDLFCGSGFFTIPLADYVANPIGVEIVPAAIETANINSKLNNKTIRFEVAKTEDYPWQDFKPDTLIVDPPRAGLHDRTISQIKSAKPENIIYVSCNYKALARELAILADTYTVVSMEAIDMFPHTPHVEVVTTLKATL